MSLLMNVTRPPTATVTSFGLTPLAVIVIVGGPGGGVGVGAGVGGLGAVGNCVTGGAGGAEPEPQAIGNTASMLMITATESLFVIRQHGPT
jgi:hypothetical protein